MICYVDWERLFFKAIATDNRTYGLFNSAVVAYDGMVLTTVVFLAGYGASRFLVEFFFQPDAKFRGPENPLGWTLDFGSWGVTMGQSLSTPMIALGLIVIMMAKRSAP